MKKKLVYVGFSYVHHKGTHAGYNKIEEYLNYDYKIDCQKWFEASVRQYPKFCILRNFIRKVLNRCFYFTTFPWYLFKVCYLGIIKKNLVFHFVYGENLYFPIVRKILNRSNSVVCTYHQPLEWFRKWNKYLDGQKRINHIILVSNSELESFKTLFGNKNITYIPHGICTDFYKPEFNIKKEKIILTVGSWLRDYAFANKVYQRLLSQFPDIEIFIVSNPKNKKMIEENSRIHFLSGISDEELKTLYCKSCCLFLPLIRYTANNSLLEAGATGCNIVIASDNPDNSYIPENFINLTPLKIDETVSAIVASMKCEYNYELANYVKEKFSWEVISDQTKNLLNSI